MGVQKYLPNCWKMALNGNLPLLSSSKNHSHCACHAHQRPTHSQCLESSIMNTTSLPIASLLEWQWHRIVMRNSQFYLTTLLETELVGPPNAEKSHTRSQSQSQSQMLQARVGDPTTHPPPHPPFPPETGLSTTNPWKTQWGGQAPPKCRYGAEWESGKKSKKRFPGVNGLKAVH